MIGLPFFAVEELPPPGSFTLTGAEGRHASAARRMRAGERVVLTDGAGGLAVAVVTGAARDRLDLAVRRTYSVPAPALRVTLVQALPKGDRGELAIELATEAGVDAIVPWAAERCIARWSGAKATHGGERWRGTARAAAKQSRRAWTPEVRPLAGTAEVAALLTAASAAVVLHESGAEAFPTRPLPAIGELALVVGPEGGITDRELAVFRGAGARIARLGPQVVRTSTAGALALAALGAVTDRWSRARDDQVLEATSGAAESAGRPASAGQPESAGQ